MKAFGPSPEQLVHRLLAHRPPPFHDAPDRETPIAHVEVVLQAVAAAFTRAFGPLGYHALLTRALSGTRREHAVLASVAVRSPREPVLEGLSPAAAGGEDAVLAALRALLIAQLALIGRLMGTDVAVSLLLNVLGPEGPPGNVVPRATSIETPETLS